MENTENSIERQIEIKAPVEKVWKALTDSQLFGQWFGATFPAAFVAGEAIKGRNTSKGYEMDMTFRIREIKPQSYFAYAWNPFPMDPKIDYEKEEPTLVEFFLEATAGGTLLKVRESGFNKITASRRAEAFKMHTGGWEAQLKNVAKFVA
ncbi:MAG: SRPBCC family protein [Polyangiaceae bacterium]|nr:SRPBCC family protein [Polyangiaceae bacterium]